MKAFFLSCILHPDRIVTSPCGLPVTSCSALPAVGLSRAPGVHQKTFHSGASQTAALCAASQPPLSRRGRVLSDTITFHSSQRQSDLFTLAALLSPFPSPVLRLVLTPLIDSLIQLQKCNSETFLTSRLVRFPFLLTHLFSFQMKSFIKLK